MYASLLINIFHRLLQYSNFISKLIVSILKNSNTKFIKNITGVFQINNIMKFKELSYILCNCCIWIVNIVILTIQIQQLHKIYDNSSYMLNVPNLRKDDWCTTTLTLKLAVCVMTSDTVSLRRIIFYLRQRCGTFKFLKT